MCQILGQGDSQTFLDCKNIHGHTLIHHAVARQDIETLQLVKKEVGPDFWQLVVDSQENPEELTPLLMAAEMGDQNMVEWLHRQGGDLFKQKADGQSILHMSAIVNDLRLLDYSWKRKTSLSNINMKCQEGWTAAHHAAFWNQFDSLNYLIENGADLSMKCNKGFSCYENMIR